MNFTREPIIETVITPREGCKLVVRSSKGASQEDYFVDAVEVVSFGHSFFFRSQERPKSFLVPVSDYEILELKETRMVLKNVSTDRSIKIGGGREAPPRQREEEPQDALAESRPAPQADQQQQPQHRDRKRDKRRRGRRGRDRDRPDMRDQQQPREAHEHREESEFQPPEEHQLPPEGGPQASGEEKAPSFISKLFPPPPTLIKESLSRYKPAEGAEEEFKEKPTFDETMFEHPTSQDSDADDENEE
ncbi:MAG: hypothetical protein K1X28_08600 [Parachlamydiales bacterium]|nr:hypothetical protein [Parachlamydiales bacterium]